MSRFADLAWAVVTGALMAAIALATVAVCGCTSLTVPIRAANATRATAVELIAVVDAVCTEPARAAVEARLSPEASAAEAERLEALGCPEAWRAQTAISEAHGAMVALLTAIQAGQCQATVAAPAPARCDLGRATMALVEAGARLVRAVDALRAEVER